MTAILAEITRGPIVESRHRGAVAVVAPDGRLIASAGDIDLVTYLRSSAKPHQAIAVITSGAAERFNFDDRELALMAGSHSGDAIHVECAAAILAKLGLDKEALRCGIHTPFSRTAAESLGPEGATELHNNCSGKHAGMLAQALIGNHSLDDYYRIDHPVQQAIAVVIAAFAGITRDHLIISVDGCSAATFAVSVRQMALMYARLVNPLGIAAEFIAPARRVAAAMTSHPELVAADKGRIDTDLMRALPGRLVAKAGAEGVYTMGLYPCKEFPDGLGIAIKIEDGDINRARNAAIIGTLMELGVFTSAQFDQFAATYLPPIKSHRGIYAGEIRPTVKF